MKVLELFGGIGACSKALERLEIDYEIADYVEIDKYAVKSFNAIHNTNFEPQDICEWDKDIEVDLIMHGSPCQDFSLSGLQKSGDKGSGTRSSLMWETIRIVEKLKPKYVIWENVKNLLSKKHIHNFDAYLETMEKLGYTNYYQVLNAKDYGIPQNRERVFTVSILGNEKYEFPEKQELKLRLKDMLEDEVDEKYYISDKFLEHTNFFVIPRGSDGKLINGSYNRVWKKEKYCGAINLTKIQEVGSVHKCIQAGNLKGGKWDKINESCRRFYSDEGLSPTIHTCPGGNTEPKVLTNLIIRKLIPKECWRLMGFDDEDYEKAAKVNSASQLYKQAGNSICVPVLEAILTNLLLDNQEKGQTNIYDYL